MSSSCALCGLPWVKKQNDVLFSFLDRARHRKIVKDKDSQNTEVDEGGKGAVP